MPARPTIAANVRHQEQVYSCLTHDQRRQILTVLADAGSSLSENELATRLVDDTSTVGDDELEPTLVELRHVHLPLLAEATLVDWDRERHVVSSASPTGASNAADNDRLDTSWSSVSSALSHRYRRFVLSTVSQHGGEMPFDRLVRSVREHERDRDAVPSADEIRTSLHHVHLPVLDSIGFLEYDHETGSVTVLGHPAIGDGWIASTIGHPVTEGPVLVCVHL